MNTKGHESVAKTAGIPLLEDVFGKDKHSLQAFYLGNWLTDVSQAVDPVAYWAASSEAKKTIDAIVNDVKKSIDNLIDESFATIYDWLDVPKGSQVERVLRSLKSDLNPYIDNAKNALHQKIDFYVFLQSNERESLLAMFFRSAFLVKGYFKFVHPESTDQKPRMNFECFMRVFGRPTDTRGAMTDVPANDRPGAYTQYYPHEHLDRPEILPPQNPPIFAPGLQIIARPFRVEKG